MQQSWVEIIQGLVCIETQALELGNLIPKSIYEADKDESQTLILTGKYEGARVEAHDPGIYS